MNVFLGLLASISSGVIVSLITLWFAARQRTKEERLAERQRRDAVLAGIGRELQWNRTAIRDIEIGNAHFMIGNLKTVAFERHGAELATIAPESLQPVFEHYATIARLREGVRTLAGPYTTEPNGRPLQLLIDLLSRATAQVGNSATASLNSLGIPLEPHPNGD